MELALRLTRIFKTKKRCFQHVFDLVGRLVYPYSPLGQFTVKHRPELLLATMRDVLLAADSERPDRVTQRAYNAARSKAGHPDSPRADRIAARFGVPWATLCDRVAKHENPAYALAVASKQQVRRLLTLAEAAAALRTAAARRGTQDISPDAYERARQLINADIARRHLHAAHIAPLPSADTIRVSVRWENALAASGLDAAIIPRRHAMPRWQAVALFIEHYGFRPTINETRWFGRYHRIALADHMREPHGEAFSAAQASFAELGRWFPTKHPKIKPDEWQASASSDLPAIAAAATAYPAVQRAGYSLDEARAAVSRAFDLCDPDLRLTSDRYRALSAQHGLPGLTQINRVAAKHGMTFATIRADEAAARIGQSAANIAN